MKKPRASVQYRSCTEDLFIHCPPHFLSARSSNQLWIDVFSSLLILLITIALISSASTGVAAIDISPSPSPTPAYAPSINLLELEATRVSTAASPSSRSASTTNSNGSSPPPPAYGFNRGFDKPYQKMTILIAGLFIATLVIGFCTHYVTLRSLHVRRGGGDPEAQSGGEGAYEGGAAGRGGGLDPCIVRSLPTVKYSAASRMKAAEEGIAAADGERDDGVPGMGPATAMGAIVKQECAVCLSEFEEGEEMKTLPECAHAFHSACIDMWLYSHTTCPICRLSLVKKRSSKQIKLAPNHSLRRGDRTSQQASTSTFAGHVTPISWHDHVDTLATENARNSLEDARSSSAALLLQHS